MNYPLNIKYCVCDFLQWSVLLTFYKLTGKGLNGFSINAGLFVVDMP